jgi:hypothetical protein
VFDLIPFLDREEYIEQVYFFRTYLERLEENVPSQEILKSIKEEILATTKLPIALDFLRGEMLSTGRISDGMSRLSHYFRPFQIYVISQAEEDRSKFDQRTALKILEREAEYFLNSPKPAGLFIYQFECVSRNRLGYDMGMKAIAADPHYSEEWSDWILKARLQLGVTDFTDLVYYRSEQFVLEQQRRTRDENARPNVPILFGEQEGRIAKANRGKDPMFMFAALQRQLGHPSVPRPQEKPKEPVFHPALESRFQRLEKRTQLLESESKGPLDLSQFYESPPDFKQMDEI